MNRAQRRASRCKDEKAKTYVLNADQIKQMKDNAVQEATETAFVLMLGLPVMVLHDKYAQLMKREGREERFTDLLLELYDSFNEDYFTLNDVIAVLKEECGIEITKKR